MNCLEIEIIVAEIKKQAGYLKKEGYNDKEFFRGIDAGSKRN